MCTRSAGRVCALGANGDAEGAAEEAEDDVISAKLFRRLLLGADTAGDAGGEGREGRWTRICGEDLEDKQSTDALVLLVGCTASDKHRCFLWAGAGLAAATGDGRLAAVAGAGQLDASLTYDNVQGFACR